MSSSGGAAEATECGSHDGWEVKVPEAAEVAAVAEAVAVEADAAWVDEAATKAAAEAAAAAAEALCRGMADISSAELSVPAKESVRNLLTRSTAFARSALSEPETFSSFSPALSLRASIVGVTCWRAVLTFSLSDAAARSLSTISLSLRASS